MRRPAPAATLAATNRDGRPLHLLAFLGVGLAVTLALVGVDRWFVRPRPTELLPADADNRPDPPQWMKVGYVDSYLRLGGPGLRVVRPPDSAFCYVCDADADPSTLADIPPTEEYADRWRGVVLCEPDQPALPDGPHSCRAGDFWLFGDLELMERVRPAAESIHFGPYRGGALTPAERARVILVRLDPRRLPGDDGGLC